MTTLLWSFVAGLFVGCMLGILIAALCHMSRLAGEDDRAEWRIPPPPPNPVDQSPWKATPPIPFAGAGKPHHLLSAADLPEGTP